MPNALSRKMMQRIVSVQYAYPSTAQVSPEARDLIGRIFVQDPVQVRLHRTAGRQGSEGGLRGSRGVKGPGSRLHHRPHLCAGPCPGEPSQENRGTGGLKEVRALSTERETVSSPAVPTVIWSIILAPVCRAANA